MADLVSSGLVLLGMGLLLAAALHDVAVRTIPNWMPAAVAGAGLIMRFQHADLIAALGGAAVLLAILGVLWLRGLIGGGDMKLIPAAALMLPPHDVGTFVLAVPLAGGVLALAYLAASVVVRRPRAGRRRYWLARLRKAEAWRMHRRGPIPYAVAIAVGALPILLHELSG